jgi:hypothetical protein
MTRIPTRNISPSDFTPDLTLWRHATSRAVTSPFPGSTPHVTAKPKTLSRQKRRLEEHAELRGGGCTVKFVPNIRLEISRVEHFEDLSVDGRIRIEELKREVGLSSSGLRTVEDPGQLTMKLHVPYRAGNLLTSCVTTSFFKDSDLWS